MNFRCGELIGEMAFSTGSDTLYARRCAVFLPNVAIL